jgi:hypothetical protein
LKIKVVEPVSFGMSNRSLLFKRLHTDEDITSFGEVDMWGYPDAVRAEADLNAFRRRWVCKP